jgi:hypothetical protein
MKLLQLLYVDPGSGYMLAQIVTGLAGAVVIFKEKILWLFRKGGGEDGIR